MIATFVLFSVFVAVPAGAATRTQVRGFDGKTVKVAGIGIAAQLPGAEWGARGRIERFNQDNEIKGVQIEYVEFADDKQDPATALSEVRRLVTQEQVFAIVGDVSTYNPGEYLAQQQVPYFGGGFDATYCSPKPNPNIWAFAYAGCRTPTDPSFVPDLAKLPYKYVSDKTSKKHPTVAAFSADNATGKNTVASMEAFLKGVGFDVVFAEAMVPVGTGVSDYTPYAQRLLTSDDGAPPDLIWCALGVECLSIYTVLTANSYPGTYTHGVYSDSLVKPFTGAAATVAFNNLGASGVPALDQMRTDVAAVKPGQKIDNAVAYGYFSTDMFITALKKAAKKGTKGITPANVRKIAASQTWEIKDLVGPTKYPDSTVASFPACQTMMISDGTTWNTVEDYACSRRRFTP